MIYFGADWHLGHNKIIEFCNRPFPDIDVMRDSFFYEWRSKVTKNDLVYLLGDIAFKNSYIDDLRELPGSKILIRGNHDPDKFCNSDIWIASTHYAQIRIDQRKIVLSHFPIEAWNGMRHGSIHLHGHTHNNTSHSIYPIHNRIDTGYDHTNQALSTLDELLELQLREEVGNRFNRIMNSD